MELRMKEITFEIVERLERLEDFDLISTLATELPFAVIWELLEIPQELRNACQDWLSLNKPSPALEERLSQLSIFEGDEEISSQHRVKLIRFILLAATDTTRTLIGNATLALLKNQDQLEILRENRELMPSAVEEALRYEAPAPLAERRTTQEVEIDGITIPAKAFVCLMIGSANRDPEVFEDPDRFLITRDASRHLSFGDGPHYCLGAQLTRMETAAALEGLFFQTKKVKALESLDSVRYIASSKLRGLTALKLTCCKV
jgi:cytochrome P450